MNERIENLMYHAGLTAQGCWDNMDEYDREAIEKFAELIVRECIDIASKYDEPKMSGPGLMIGHMIEQHFGVET